MKLRIELLAPSAPAIRVAIVIRERTGMGLAQAANLERQLRSTKEPAVVDCDYLVEPQRFPEVSAMLRMVTR